MKSKVSNKMGRLSRKVGRREKLLSFYYEHPEASPSVRKLAAYTKTSRSTVQRTLNKFRQENLITKENKWDDTWQNRTFKTDYYAQKIIRSGLVEYLRQELAASTIILFGSIAKGESNKDSDIDIFVSCARNKHLNLIKYEKKIGHHIELFTRPSITKLPKHLLNNVVNGRKLWGYFTIK